jgi:uncharacterized phage protein (TIGR02220 family)
MAESKVIRENYISLQGWMIIDLQLKGNELIIYACIYGFSQAENQVFSGSLQYLADWTNTTKQSVVNCLKSLTEKGYIVKTDKIINGVKFCEYYAKDLNEVYKNFEYPMQKSLTGGIQKSLTNNIDSNNLLNNIKDIIYYLNSKIGSKYSYKSKKTQDCIKARFNEIDGLTVEDFYTVIDKQHKKWSGTDMAQYLRPETLFGNKFESYLNAPTNTTEKRQANTNSTDDFMAQLKAMYQN